MPSGSGPLLAVAALLVTLPAMNAVAGDMWSLNIDGPDRVMGLEPSAGSSKTPPGLSTLLAPGDFDPSFGTGGMTLYQLSGGTLQVRSTLVQPDDKIVVVGGQSTGTGCNVFVSRHNPDGSLDTTFANGTGVARTPISVNNCISPYAALQADGRIVVASTRLTYTPNGGSNRDFILLRYTANGLLDGTFGVGGLVVRDFATSETTSDVLIQPDGKIVLAGTFYTSTNPDMVLVRFTSTGVLDTSFGQGGRVTYGFNSTTADDLIDVTLQPDGKLLALGRTYGPGQRADLLVVRLTASGALDSTFGPGGAMRIDVFGSEDEPFTITVQTDGKLLVAGGAYHPASATYRMTLMRMYSNGAFDLTFNGTGLSTVSFGPTYNFISSLAIQPDGKIVAAGHTDLMARNRNDDAALLRFMPNGSLDSSFLGGGGFLYEGFPDSEDWSFGVGLQSDGKLIVGGESGGYVRLSRHWN